MSSSNTSGNSQQGPDVTQASGARPKEISGVKAPGRGESVKESPRIVSAPQAGTSTGVAISVAMTHAKIPTTTPKSMPFAHAYDSDEEGEAPAIPAPEPGVRPLPVMPAIAKTLEVPKPTAAAQQRHNEVVGLLNVLASKMDGMQEQIRLLQTDIKLMKESTGRIGSTGPATGVYTRVHY